MAATIDAEGAAVEIEPELWFPRENPGWGNQGLGFDDRARGNCDRSPHHRKHRIGSTVHTRRAISTTLSDQSIQPDAVPEPGTRIYRNAPAARHIRSDHPSLDRSGSPGTARDEHRSCRYDKPRRNRHHHRPRAPAGRSRVEIPATRCADEVAKIRLEYRFETFGGRLKLNVTDGNWPW